MFGFSESVQLTCWELRHSERTFLFLSMPRIVLKFYLLSKKSQVLAGKIESVKKSDVVRALRARAERDRSMLIESDGLPRRRICPFDTGTLVFQGLIALV